MGGWFETILVVIVIIAGGMLGRLFSRMKYPCWCCGYFIPLALVAILITATLISFKTFISPVVWLSGGRIRFVIIGFSCTMGATTLYGRLGNILEKAIVIAFTSTAVTYAAILPFLVPAMIQNELSGLQTKIDAEDICSQSTDFTCGPAAAVTALRQLGLTAHESEMAILSHTSPISGTMPWCLYKAIQNRYADQGLDCSFRRFDSIDQLDDVPVMLAVVKDAFMLDHCVAVIDIGKDTVTIGDPILGRIRMTREDFAGIWRFYGIVLRHNPS